MKYFNCNIDMICTLLNNIVDTNWYAYFFTITLVNVFKPNLGNLLQTGIVEFQDPSSRQSNLLGPSIEKPKEQLTVAKVF